MTASQRQRAEILFREYTDQETAYGLSHSLRIIFSRNSIKDAARLSMAKNGTIKWRRPDSTLSTSLPQRSMSTTMTFWTSMLTDHQTLLQNHSTQKSRLSEFLWEVSLMKSFSSTDLLRFMLTPTEFPLTPQGSVEIQWGFSWCLKGIWTPFERLSNIVQTTIMYLANLYPILRADASGYTYRRIGQNL